MPTKKSLEQILAEAGDWISAQNVLRQCGHGNNVPTEDVERFYAELRDLDLVGRLEVKPITDSEGRKIEDHIRLKAA